MLEKMFSLFSFISYFTYDCQFVIINLLVRESLIWTGSPFHVEAKITE